MRRVGQLVAGSTVTVGMDEAIEQVYALLIRNSRRFAVVCQGSRATAVVDREHLLDRLAAANRSASRPLLVRDVVHPGTPCVRSGLPVGEVASLMRATGSSALPVVDERHHLLGLVTATDVAAAQPAGS